MSLDLDLKMQIILLVFAFYILTLSVFEFPCVCQYICLFTLKKEPGSPDEEFLHQAQFVLFVPEQ